MGYRDSHDELAKLDAKVIGISGDAVSNLRHFKKVNKLNFTLLSDISGSIAAKFGVPVRDGGKFTKIIDDQEVLVCRANTPNRWTFILDNTGKIIYKDTEVDLKNDFQKVISFIQNQNN